MSVRFSLYFTFGVLFLAMHPACFAQAKKAGASSGKDWNLQRSDFLKESIQESLTPIRPGGAQSPFWNGQGRQFIHVPSFAFKAVPGAKEYRFDAKASDSKTYSIKSPSQFANLAEIWKEMPVGVITLTVSALDDSGSVIGKAQERIFYKAEPFEGFYHCSVSAPALDFKPIEGVTKYVCHVYWEMKDHPIELTSPPEKVPQWDDAPLGPVAVRLDAVGKEKSFQSMAFIKISPHGISDKYLSAIYRRDALELVRWISSNWDIFNVWSDPFKNIKGNDRWRYPSKFYSATIEAFILLAELTPDIAEKDKSLKMACKVADYMLENNSEPSEVKWAYMTHTYDDEAMVKKGNWGKGKMGKIMLSYPAVSAMAYLDLFEATKEQKYLKAAVNIAETYRKNQGEDGSWPLMVMRKTGEQVGKNSTVPIKEINFLCRLMDIIKSKNYDQTIVKAAENIEKNRVKTFNWEAQFEDMDQSPPYYKQSPAQAAEFAIWLLNNRQGDSKALECAEELMAFVEDQFAVWEKAFIRHEPWWQDYRKNRGHDDSYDYYTPCVIEQYHENPVDYSMCTTALGFKALNDATGKGIFKVKAIELMNNMARAIEHVYAIEGEKGRGRCPTFFDCHSKKIGGSDWINCALKDAKTLKEFSEWLENKK